MHIQSQCMVVRVTSGCVHRRKTMSYKTPNPDHGVQAAFGAACRAVAKSMVKHCMATRSVGRRGDSRAQMRERCGVRRRCADVLNRSRVNMSEVRLHRNLTHGDCDSYLFVETLCGCPKRVQCTPLPHETSTRSSAHHHSVRRLWGCCQETQNSLDCQCARTR
jgi:hypothetical protein